MIKPPSNFACFVWVSNATCAPYVVVILDAPPDVEELAALEILGVWWHDGGAGRGGVGAGERMRRQLRHYHGTAVQVHPRLTPG